jgi:hypothetical protein
MRQQIGGFFGKLCWTWRDAWAQAQQQSNPNNLQPSDCSLGFKM